MKLVKYKNRKMYAPELRSWVTHAQLMKLMRDGVEFQVICHKTKNDITAQTQLAVLSSQYSILKTDSLNSLLSEVV